jgi:protein phosphatase
MEFKSFGFSDVGKTHEHNEDSYLRDDKEGLFVVADGMGGHVSGEMASQLAVESVEEFVSRSRSESVHFSGEYRSDLSIEQNRLLAATRVANRKIREEADKNPTKRGMGTTLIGVILEDKHLAVVNVGDSRLYRVRNGDLKQVTNDHTLVAEQQKLGRLTKDEARKHPQRHILTSALGISESPKIDLYRTKVIPDDLYLICSDGLNDMLDDEEILNIIHSIKDKSLFKIGLSLVLQANLAGGQDNITVILLSF